MKMYFDAIDHCQPEVITHSQNRIAKYHGQEVFFGGRVDDSGKIYELEVLARGNEKAVPVVYREAENYDLVLHNHPSGIIRPSDADLQVASVLADYGVGFYIIDNNFSKINIVIPLSKPDKKKELKEEDVLAFFSQGKKTKDGLLETLEERSSQKKMVAGIVRAFNQDEIYTCEAPTGTGKSMAYLVPAFHWIKVNGERVVVSTNTINLQEQLIQKDIPQVERRLGQEVSYALVKGRGNYLCQRKFARFKSAWKGNFPELMEKQYQTHHVNELLEWGGKTSTGDKGELSFVPPSALWEQVASEADTCRRSKCPALEHCFYQKSRKRIFSANLLIVNHHILCADAALKREAGKYHTQALLPAYNRLIIDEAHNLDEVGTSYFAQTASRFALERNLGLVARLNKKRDGVIGGVLFSLYEQVKKQIKKKPAKSKQIKVLDAILATFIQSFKKFSPKLNQIFEELFDYLEKKVDSDFQEKKLRFKTSFLEDALWRNAFKAPIENLSADLRAVVGKIKKVEALFEDDEVGEELEQILHELSVYRARLENIIGVCQQSLNLEVDEKIHWVTGSRKRPNRVHFSIHISPLYVAEELSDALFNPLKTVVLTSATLRDSRGFEFFSQSVGLDRVEEDRLVFEHLASNFNYKDNCTFIIPSVFPLPQFREFNEEVGKFIEQVVSLFDGGTLVLFTSYGQLLRVTDEVRESLSEKGYSLLVQGEAPRQQLVERFKMGSKNILCGVNSFWEGIDIKGKALSCLVMVKIPFIVPSDPIHEARLQEIEKKGRNSFTEYMVPQAVIRFKQGFGRLLRGTEDKGIFVVLDRRLIVKSYGRTFIDALPTMPISDQLPTDFD